VALQDGQRGWGDALDATSMIPAGDLQERCQNRLDIFWPFAERRDAQLVDVQSIVEVQAESPGFDLSRQIFVRGSDHANVDADAACVAQRIDLATLQDA
jgi:hypothetical protein